MTLLALSPATTSLPTGDDYVFRIQVISTATNIATDVFKKAVQGLVKICFPQDVLEEIGIEVVTQHMRNEGAPEENILKMTDIFRSEMIHRVTWMLAEYLDTPPKVEASVKSIVAASASLHGAKIGEDVLGHVLQSLRITPAADTIESDREASDPANESEANEAPVHATNGAYGDEVDHARKRGQDAGGDSDAPNSHDHGQLHLVREGKEARVSASWRWDIEEGTLLANMIPNFKRVSDLFAYHALPIAKQQLEPQAKRKEIRQKIEAMLAMLPPNDFEKWADSFQRLKSGEVTMLRKVSVDPSSVGQRTGSAIPAPIVIRSDAERVAEHISSAVDPVDKSPRVNGARLPTAIKHEVEAETEDAEVVSPGLTEPCHRSRHTPIVDLLWGPSTYTHLQRDDVAKKILDQLSARVSAKSVGIALFNAKTVVQTLEELRTQLTRGWSLNPQKFNHNRSRAHLEPKLVPWVLANMSSFPSLHTEPALFAHLMPSTNRGPYGNQSHHYIINTLKANADDMTKRGRIERWLRYIAFADRHKFSELRASPLVRTWERETGLKWVA
ncbi:hypothetical protein EJ07DRAFT_180179 [Lizonia empirigonia]|nr:hypothetical protein EJ07DRAFT_180179 [Lizonia empirigonia]